MTGAIYLLTEFIDLIPFSYPLYFLCLFIRKKFGRNRIRNRAGLGLFFCANSQQNALKALISFPNML